MSRSGYGNQMISISSAVGYAQDEGFNTGYVYWPSLLTLSFIRDVTQGDKHPIYASFSNNGIGHAVVIRGYSATTSNPIISYMDPASGTYKASNYPSDGTPTYVTASGTTLYLDGGFAPYK